MTTIKPEVVEPCGCHEVDEGEFEMCQKHWDELQRDITWMHDDRDLSLERALWKLLVEDV